MIITGNRWAGPKHCQILHKLHILWVLSLFSLAFLIFIHCAYFKRLAELEVRERWPYSLAHRGSGGEFKTLSLYVWTDGTDCILSDCLPKCMKGLISELSTLLCVCSSLWIVLCVWPEMIFLDMNTVSASPKVHPPNGTRFYTFQVSEL